MTAQERLAELLEVVETPTNALVTIGSIRDSIGLTVEQYGLVRGTLETAIATLKADADPAKRIQGIDLQDALSAMLAGGISLSGADRQSTIDLLAVFGQWPDAVRDALKGLGVRRQARWQIDGYESEPTLESVQAEIDAARLINAKALFSERMTVGGDADAVWSQTWTDAEAV